MQELLGVVCGRWLGESRDVFLFRTCTAARVDPVETFRRPSLERRRVVPQGLGSAEISRISLRSEVSLDFSPKDPQVQRFDGAL